MSDQPVPAYGEEDLERILARDFGDAAAHAQTILAGYGTESFQREPLRVRMACLKLASGSLESLEHHVRNACQDYRDVLAWAEYPAYLDARGADDQERAVASDWQQLQQWLGKP